MFCVYVRGVGRYSSREVRDGSAPPPGAPTPMYVVCCVILYVYMLICVHPHGQFVLS